MATPKNIHNKLVKISDRAMSRNCYLFFSTVLDILIQEEKASLLIHGGNPRKARDLAEQRLVQWFQKDDKSLFGEDGIQCLAFKYCRTGYILTKVLRSLLHS